jgi:hypothetical protein
MPDKKSRDPRLIPGHPAVPNLSTKTPNLYGKLGGPSGTVNNDLSESEFNKRFKDGAFAGKYQTIVEAAHKHNIPASLMASIIGFETGWGKSSAVTNFNNPAGVMAGGRGNRTFHKYDTLDEGVDAAGAVMKKNFEAGGQTIPGMAAIYAPIGKRGKPVANDPHGTNKQWPGTVARLQKNFQEATSGEEIESRQGRELDQVVPTVNGKGKLTVDAPAAPKGVEIKASTEGDAFNKTELNRQNAMSD